MENAIVTQSESEAMVQLTEKKLFTQDHMQSLLWIVLSLGCLTALLVFFSLILFKNMLAPPRLYFQATEDKQIIPEIPLEQPGIANNVLLTWVVEGMNLAHTFNFMNYTAEMEKAKVYFSKEGYEDYVNALNAIELLKRTVENKWVVIAMPTEVPEILKEGPLGNRYLWKVKMPIQFHYRNVTTYRTEEYDLILLVVRVPSTQSPEGVIIYKYELQTRAVKLGSKLNKEFKGIAKQDHRTES